MQDTKPAVPSWVRGLVITLMLVLGVLPTLAVLVLLWLFQTGILEFGPMG